MHKATAFFFVCAGLLGLALLLPRPAAAAWPTDPTRERADLHRHRRSVASHHRLGRRGRGHRHLVGPPQRHTTTSTPSGSRPTARSSGRPTAWPSAPPPATRRPHHRLGRRGRGHRHLDGLPAAAPTTSTPSGSRPLARSSGRPTAWPSAPPPAIRRTPPSSRTARAGPSSPGRTTAAARLRHLRPADLGRWHGPVDGQRRGPLHRHRRSARPHHRLGRRGRGHRHLGGRPQRHRLRHLRPADLGRWHGPVDGQRRGPLHRHRRSDRPHHRLGRRGRGHRHLGGLPQRHRLRHLRPADLGRRHGPVDGRRRGPLHRHRRSAYPTIVSDGAGGAIVTWKDHRSGTSYDIYAQRISAGGTVQWTANGVALCTATGDQSVPHHRLGRRGRGHRHLAGPPQRQLPTSTPSGSRPAARSSGRPTAWPSAPPPATRAIPPSSRTARAGPSSPGRTTAAAALRHLRPARAGERPTRRRRR